MGPDLEPSVTRVLDEVVVVEVVDEEPHTESDVGDRCVECVGPVPKSPWTVEDHRLGSLRLRPSESEEFPPETQVLPVRTPWVSPTVRTSSPTRTLAVLPGCLFLPSLTVGSLRPVPFRLWSESGPPTLVLVHMRLRSSLFRFFRSTFLLPVSWVCYYRLLSSSFGVPVYEPAFHRSLEGPLTFVNPGRPLTTLYCDFSTSFCQ